MSQLAPAIERVFSPLMGWVNRARLGFPSYCFQGAGGIGDDLMCTTVFHELRKRGVRGIAFATVRPSLFEGNPDLDHVLHYERPRVSRWLQEGLPFVPVGYARYDSATDRDEPLTEHVLEKMCRQAGVTGEIELRPYLYLNAQEIAGGRLGGKQIVVQTSTLGAAYPMRNKEWYAERFQQVCDQLRGADPILQIGSAGDPKLEGAVDLRGQTSLRQSAAILANSVVFIGLEGLLMHMARAVDCRAVIIYGGRLRPWQIGYSANQNLIGEPPCSPCWLRNRCDFEHVCMSVITSDAVVAAARAQIELAGQPLPLETATL